MRIIKSICICILLFCYYPQVYSQEIIIPDNVAKQIEFESSKDLKTIPLDKVKERENKLFLRTWVSGSIDLKGAKERKSSVAGYVSYQKKVKLNPIRLSEERLTIRKNPTKKGEAPTRSAILKKKQIKKLKIKEPILIIYREGSNYFKYKKFVQKSAQIQLNDAEFLKTTREFLTGNDFLKETLKDIIGDSFVQKHKVNQETATEGAFNDHVVRQDAILKRHYDGKPVLNSKIIIGIFPSEKDIVLFDHFNWSPLKEDEERTIDKSVLKDLANYLDRLINKVRAACQGSSKATITEVFPAWYQTETEVIPVLAYWVDMQYSDGTNSRFIDAINLVGSDMVFSMGH